MKTLFLILAYCLFFVPASAQDIKVSIDFESAKAVVDALSKNEISDAEIERIAKLEGNRALINKMTSLKLKDSENVFKKTLGEVIRNGKTSGADSFRWLEVKANLQNIRNLTARIEGGKITLLADLNKIIADYAPKDLKADVKAHLLVGGWSLGFLNDGDSALNIALHRVGDDFEGLKFLLAHELYHSVQAIGDEKRKANLAKSSNAPPTNILNAYNLAFNTYNEGAAAFVGDFTRIKNPLAFAVNQQAEYEKNARRMRRNFALFEVLLFRAYNDSTADSEQLYSVAFSTAFDQSGYYVGCRMMEIVEKYEGKTAVAAFVNKNPLEFFRKYIEIYKKHDEPQAVKFSPAIEKILLDMQIWNDKL